MNGFISWHLWIKEIYNDTLVMDYKKLANLQRNKKTEFFEKIYDDLFSNLKIKRFYLSSRKVFVQQEITKTKIIKPLMSVMTAKTHKKKQEKDRVDNAAVISSKKMFDIIGQSKFYSRNNDSIHETNSETRFRENCLWIRVNEHFTPDVCYRINSDKYKIC